METDIGADDAIKTFDNFNIKLDNSQGQEQPAYGNIRFKTMKEKSSKKASNEDKEGLSTIE